VCVRFSFQGPRERGVLRSGPFLLRSIGRRTLVSLSAFVNFFFVTVCFSFEAEASWRQTPRRDPFARRAFRGRRLASRGGTEKLVARPEKVKAASPICFRFSSDPEVAAPEGVPPGGSEIRGAAPGERIYVEMNKALTSGNRSYPQDDHRRSWSFRWIAGRGGTPRLGQGGGT